MKQILHALEGCGIIDLNCLYLFRLDFSTNIFAIIAIHYYQIQFRKMFIFCLKYMTWQLPA